MTNEIKSIIENILSSGSFSFEEVVVRDGENDTMIWYQIKSPDSKSLIGHNGETLSALNHLVKKIVEKKKKEDVAIIDFFIDVNDYQKKKIDSLKTVAHMMAERARFFKSSVDVDPMTAFERKIIHSYLASQPDVITESVGVGPTRHIVIKYSPKEII